MHSFYNKTTGQFLALQMSVPAGELARHIPPGHAAIKGVFDHLCRRVEHRPDDFGDAYPVVVAWQPPAPADDERQTWQWDADSERWVSAPTDTAIAAQARAERDRRIAASDWLITRATETGAGVPQAWLDYRQALRDISHQPGFPTAITWPEPPQ